MRGQLLATISEDSKNEASEYYKRLAVRVSIIKYILAVFIIAFIIISFANFKSEITVENFRYMLKFFDFSSSAKADDGQIVLDLNRDFVVSGLRNNLAVADSTGISIYDYSGKRLLRSTYTAGNPFLSSSSKYVYAYDLGGNLLKIFNSYSEIYTVTTDYPIIGFANNLSGAFGYITSANDYKSAIIVHDKEFRQIFSRYFGESYAMGIAINNYGNRVVTLLNSVSGGDYYCELLEFDITQEEPINKIKFIGEMPLKLFYTEENMLMVLTSKALRMYDINMNLISEMFFEGNVPSGYYFFDKYAIMSYITRSIQGKSEIDVYGMDGSLLRTVSFDEEIKDVETADDMVYVLTYSKLYVIDVLGGESGDSNLETDGKASCLARSGDYIIVVSSDSATVIKAQTASSNTSEENDIFEVS